MINLLCISTMQLICISYPTNPLQPGNINAVPIEADLLL